MPGNILQEAAEEQGILEAFCYYPAASSVRKVKVNRPPAPAFHKDFPLYEAAYRKSASSSGCKVNKSTESMLCLSMNKQQGTGLWLIYAVCMMR